MKREILEKIDKLFADTSQTMAKTRADLEEIRDRVDELIATFD